MLLSRNHTQRFDLNHELHARPFAELRPPAHGSYFALLSGDAGKPVEQQCLAELCARYDRPAPTITGNHFSADLGPFQIKWERHTEFTSYTFLGNAPLTVASRSARRCRSDQVCGRPAFFDCIWSNSAVEIKR